nr:immunoglobulin heavy chain junction region [Macaca mulatta]MOX67744.1 immunoglobulin heavy chain junction region [Macaca mulatta]
CATGEYGNSIDFW